MSCKAQHDVSDVLLKLLLNFGLGLSEVKYIQLIKLVPQKNANRLSCKFNERKLRKRENKQNDAMLNLLARDSLGTSGLVVKEARGLTKAGSTLFW